MDPRKLIERIHASYSRNRATAVFHLFAIDPVPAAPDLTPAATSTAT